MKPFVEYDPTTGQIVMRGFGTPDPTKTTLVVADTVRPNTHKIDLATLAAVPKTPMSLTWPTTSTPADGVTEAMIAGVPVGTRCSFYLSSAHYYFDITDGTFELSVYDPQIVRVLLWHPLFIHDPVALEFA